MKRCLLSTSFCWFWNHWLPWDGNVLFGSWFSFCTQWEFVRYFVVDTLMLFINWISFFIWYDVDVIGCLQALEAATKVVKEEEEIKQKLCEDLNQLVRIFSKWRCEFCYSLTFVGFSQFNLIYWAGSRKQSLSVF